MPIPDHEPRTWCPQCGSVCTTKTDGEWTTFHHIKEPTVGTYTEEEIVKVFAERRRFREALEQIIRWQEGSVGTMRQDTTTISYAQAALKG